MNFRIILLTSITFLTFNLFAQQEFSVEIEALEIANAPSVHSFSVGKTTDGKWLIVGGRVDGLHQRQPFAAFLATENNTDAFLIDPISKQVWTKDLSSLPSAIFEQIQSTNQQFFQRGNTLYITGGYGYSAFLADHITYPNLMAINVDSLATAIINNTNISSYFRQIADEEMAVTGGQIGYLDSTFYLCGGQLFEGRYNPMGPDFGPGFIQQYSDEIRKFKIEDDGTTMSITDFEAENDVTNLHRRDYNMSPQIFPNGDKGFTMFSGVFNANDLPFLNPVDITENGYSVNNTFSQYLSHYHSAKVPIFDANSSTMHNVFFGGLSQYSLDSEGELVQDNKVPFVKTISLVTRKQDGSMVESKLALEMPDFLGAGAEFIPVTNDSLYIDKEIVNLNHISEKTLIGYIYGGIHSTAENIFFVNTGTQSTASAQIFKVFLTVGKSDVSIVNVTNPNPFDLSIFPNPVSDSFTLKAKFSKSENYTLKIYNIEGKEVKRENFKQLEGVQELSINVNGIAAGEYILVLTNENNSSKQKVYIK